MNNNVNINYYYQGKVFDNFKDCHQFAMEWNESPFDSEEFKIHVEKVLRDLEEKKGGGEKLTNKEAYLHLTTKLFCSYRVEIVHPPTPFSH